MLRDEALRLMLEERGSAVVPLTAGETSMVPLLRGGDAVWAEALDAPPAPGDLVLYRQQDYWVVHRCLGRAVSPDGRPGFRTRGDGRNLLDPHLAAEDVLARVVALRRGGLWRSLKGRPARLYASGMAAHDLCWAAAGVLARRAGLGGLVASLDLGLQRVLVPVVFPLIHRRIPEPAPAGPDGAV